MRGARQPLAQTNDLFEPRFLRGNHEGDRALNHVGIVRRTIIGALDALQCVGHALDIAHVAIKTSDVRTPSCNTLTAIDLFLSKDVLRADAARFSQFVRTSGARFTLARRLLSYL